MRLRLALVVLAMGCASPAPSPTSAPTAAPGDAISDAIASGRTVATREGVAPVATLLATFLEPWELEETGKGYWIGYTEAMRAIAAHGDAAIAPTVDFLRSTTNTRARLGALFTLHLIGIESKVVGRYVEAFKSRRARHALLGLLDEPDLRVQVLLLLIRDPWPTDVPRIFELLEAGTPDDWAVVKALQRYTLAGAPVHQPLSREQAELELPRLGEDLSTPTLSQVRWNKSTQLEALRRMGDPVVVEERLVDKELWPFDGDGYSTPTLWVVLNWSLTNCDYCDLGDKLEYFTEDGKVHVCSIATAKRRWLSWYREHARALRPTDPTAVVSASFAGGTDRIAILLDAMPEGVNARGHKGATPLIVASKYGHDDVVRLLLERGADPCLVDDEGRTALHEAADEGRARVVGTLLEAGAAVDPRDGEDLTPLGLAARAGHDEVVQLLVRAGAMRDIFILAACGATDRVSRLLARDDHAARAVDRARRTPLHLAARFGHVEVVDQLLAAGARVDANAPHFGTALHEAGARGHVEVVRKLLAAHADLHAIGGLWNAHTCLQEVVREGHLEVAKVLLDAGADPNLNEHGGRPALQWACACEHLELVKLLLERGADPNQTDKDGTTAMWWATDARHNTKIETLLREHGAR